MVDVTETDTIAALRAADPRRRERQGQQEESPETGGEEGAPDDDAQAPSPHGGTADVASIAGIPANELTPKVQDAIAAVLDEYDHQRVELDQIRAHSQYLQEVADAHSFLPLMNRRAFLRELGRILGRAERIASTNTFIYFHIRTAGHIRRAYGHMAVENVLARVAEAFYERLRASDVVGSLSGNDFGVILTLADQNMAVVKADELVAAVEGLHVAWNGIPLAVHMAYGVHMFESGEDVESVLNDADRDLLGRERARERAAQEAAPEAAPATDGVAAVD